jgi:hypothetical protein
LAVGDELRTQDEVNRYLNENYVGVSKLTEKAIAELRDYGQKLLDSEKGNASATIAL